MSEPFYHNICIEGNIGAGKTSLSKVLSEELDARLILESFENNPFLDLFYKDRRRYAFQVEMFFLAERYHQLSQNLLGDIFHQYTVSDFLFAKSAIFSGINLDGAEHELFLNMFRIMERFMPRPDLLIYLHLPVDLAMKQIAERGRPYEANIEREYLVQVENSYMAFLKEESRYPVVIVEEQHYIDRQLTSTLRTVKDIINKEWPIGISHFAVKT
ncbi:MAG: deoxynucleoside kinase [Salibacteraceae bacterium]